MIANFDNVLSNAYYNYFRMLCTFLTFF